MDGQWSETFQLSGKKAILFTVKKNLVGLVHAKCNRHPTAVFGLRAKFGEAAQPLCAMVISHNPLP